jgi:hypothetical protein
MMAELGITQISSNDKYLGLPIHIRKSRTSVFEYTKQRVWAKIQGWQQKLLSKARKEILIKVVARAIPTYAMSCFDLTKGLCDELSSMIGKYWWSNQDKVIGGLGFRDLYAFQHCYAG